MPRVLIVVLALFALAFVSPLPAREIPPGFCWRLPAQLVRQGDFAWFTTGCLGNAGPDVAAIEAQFEATVATPPEASDERRDRLESQVEGPLPRRVVTVRGQDESWRKFQHRHRKAVRGW